jgi:putative nucleotidyltransferase with HDIG domain
MNQQSGAAVNQDDEKALASLVQGVKLPPQPRIVLAINEELKLADPSFAKIADLATKDAALSAKILKLINSPYYAVGREINTIKQALALLGIRNFQSIVITSSLKEIMGGNDEMTEMLWDHSLLVACLGRAIAQKVRGVDPESAYLTGLFHDAAIPLLMKKFGGFIEVLEMVVARGGKIAEFEQTKFSTHHAVVGRMLARSWGVADEVTEAIQFHHEDSLSMYSSSTARMLGAVLMLADQLARETSEDNEFKDQDPVWTLIRSQVLTELQLDENDLVDLREVASELSGMV